MARTRHSAAVDRAVSNADQDLGLSASPTRTRGGVRTYPGGRGVNSQSGGVQSRVNAVAAPRAPSGNLEPITESVFGVSGTPITSGFLRVLEEQNQWLYGRNGVRTYYEMSEGDAQCRATFAACKLPVMSAKWKVTPGDVRATGPVARTASTGAGRSTSAKAQDVADFIQDALWNLEFQDEAGSWHTQPWSTVVANALDMLVYGCAVHEDVHRIDGDAIRLRALPGRLPITFYRWITAPDGETLQSLEQYGYRRDQFLNVPLPAWKICRFTYQQKGANFWGIPLSRAMWPHYRIKTGLYRLDAIACEKNSMGIPTYRLSKGHNAEDDAEALRLLSQIAVHEKTCMIESPCDAPTDGFRVEGYKGSIRDVWPSILHHNRMISTAALAQMLELGQEGKGGSRALGESHTKFFQLAEQAIADQIAETITATTIRRLVYLNFGDGAPVPKLVAANVQARGLEEIVDHLTELAKNGLVLSTQELRDGLLSELGQPAESRKGIITTFRGEVIDAESDNPIGAPPAGAGAGQQEPGDEEQEKPGSGARGSGSGKSKSARAREMSAADAGAARRVARTRAEVSPYWHQPVASSEKHVDWREVNAHTDRTAFSLRAALGKAKIPVIQAVARQVAAGTSEGKPASEVTLKHDQALDDAITPIVQAAYETARGHVKDEMNRLRVAKHGRVPAIPTLPPTPEQSRMFAASPGSRIPSPELVADGLVQKLVNHYGVTARSLAVDGADEAEIAAGLNDLSDGYLDTLAGQGARQSTALGRFDELAGVDDEVQANGGRYERSEILDQNTCGPCAAGDGNTWDSFDEIDWEPGDDCDGGDNCRGTVIAVFG